MKAIYSLLALGHGIVAMYAIFKGEYTHATFYLLLAHILDLRSKEQ